MAAKDGNEWFEAPAHDFRKTEAISGRASSRTVQTLIQSMRTNGWLGEPIAIVEINSEKYIINGHHRAYAAGMLSIPVHYCVISSEFLVRYGYGSTDEVIQAHAEAGPNRIRLR